MHTRKYGLTPPSGLWPIRERLSRLVPNPMRSIVLVIAAVFTAAALAATPVAASGSVRYVDGKNGSDQDSGLSMGNAYKTIARASADIPAGNAAGWTVIVKGYTDYVYRERPIPTNFSSYGSAAGHIRFEAAGYVAGSGQPYVKPIVSGAEIAPLAGNGWSSSGYAGVWKTSWSTEPYWFGQLTGSLKTALFQDGSVWLWEQTSLSALASRAASGLGGYWWDDNANQLYVSAVGTPGAGTNPAGKSIEVIVRPAFYFKGTQGVRYVDVRGFQVQHSANGIAFVKGTDYSTAADNVLNGNFLMGLQTSGAQTANGPDPAIGNVLGRNSGRFNTFQLIKLDEGTQDTTVCDNWTSDNAFRGIFVQGAPGGTGYTGTTSGVTICRNKIWGHDYNPTGSAYNNAAGITIANGARNVTVDGNRIWSNDIGIFITQESAGRALITSIVLKNNDVSMNRRFGLDFYDGAYGNGNGTVTVTGDVYWGNGTGIMVSRGTTGKSVSKTTIYDSYADGIRVGEANQAAASLSVTTSLITHNGGYGMWLVTGNSASLTYTGLPSNTKGAIKGSPSTSSNNTNAAGYLSVTPSDPDYLRISNGSYQYHAGPSNTPVGARY